MVEGDRGTADGQGDDGDVDVAKTLLPPIGNRGSYRPDFGQTAQDTDKFQKAMDKIMAERAAEDEPIGNENAAGHVIARGETQMTTKHGISKIGKGVVEKFHAARHNTAIMSAMGHKGLEKLVAKEEEEKRKRRARLRELTQQRSLAGTGRSGQRESIMVAQPLAVETSAAELPNVYAALGQPSRGQTTVPGSPLPATQHPQQGGTSLPQPSSPPPAQTPPQHQQHQQQSPGHHGQGQQQSQQLHNTGQLPAAVSVPGAGGGAASGGGGAPGVAGGSLHRHGGGGGLGRGAVPAAASPRAVATRSAPGSLRPLRMSGGGDWEPQSPALRGGGTGRRGGKEGGRWRRRSQPAHPKTASSGTAVVRADSRVGRVLAEFGGHTDWCSVTVMRHSLATILQANIRGWLVRRRWLANPQAVVDSVKAALDAERAETERRIALKAELERRAMTRKQKEKAANVLHMLFPQKSMVGAAVASVHGGVALRNGAGGDNGNAVARAKWSRLNKNIDLVKDLEEDGDEDRLVVDESDSDMSDLGLEEMALIKMRARTPPWQKAEQSQWEGQWAKLNQKASRGNLDVVWDLADTQSRVQAVQQRRTERAAQAVLAGASLSSVVDSAPYDPATQPLPSTVVTDLLVHRYLDKYTRLGLLDHLPLRTAAEAAMHAKAQAAAVAAEQQQAAAHQQQQAAAQHQHWQAAAAHMQQQQQAAAGAGAAAGSGAGPGAAAGTVAA